jgi:hypothetical protein
MSDESCKKCGSDQLSGEKSVNDLQVEESRIPPKSKKMKFVKYFIFMIFAQFALLFVTAVLGAPFIFHLFYEPVFIVAASLVRMGHADVIFPFVLIILTFSMYAIAWSYLLVYSRFRESVFMPVRKDVHSGFTKARAKINGK